MNKNIFTFIIRYNIYKIKKFLKTITFVIKNNKQIYKKIKFKNLKKILNNYYIKNLNIKKNTKIKLILKENNINKKLLKNM